MFRGVIIVVVVCLALTGCYASGRRVDPQQLVELQPGVTPCAEIVQRLGPATSQSLASTGEHQLVYTYTQANVDPKSFIPLVGGFISSSHNEYTNVVFDCDRAGLLIHYAATQGQLTTGTGYISGAPQR